MKKLLFSVHDVTPRHSERLQRIDEVLAQAGIGNAYALLVIPDFWKRWPIEGDKTFQNWLRAKADAGVEIILHGLHHLDETKPRDFSGFMQASSMTKNEGEFLSLDERTARARIVDGRDRLQQILGREITGFVAPAWLYSRETKAVLAELGFRVAEDHWTVWSPVEGKRLSWSPVISYASRSRTRIVSSLLWSRLATIGLSGFDVVRLALHPHDLDVEALTVEFQRVLHHLLGRRQAIRYAELAAPA